MAADNKQNIVQQWASYSSLAFELVATVGICGVAGWLIDRYFGTTPLWLGICLGLGAIGGLYNFIRRILKLSREQQSKE